VSDPAFETLRIVKRIEGELDDLRRIQKSVDLISPFLALPALRGFWPTSANHLDAQAVNYVDDIACDYDLQNVGDAQHGYYYTAPYVDLDGATQGLIYPDDPQHDILGTEANVVAAVRGLTLGGWFWFDTLAAVTEYPLITKYDPAGNLRAYKLIRGPAAGGNIQLVVSTDGINDVAVSGAVPVISAWYFCVGRFTPSTELKVWVNGAPVTNLAGVPASIFNSDAMLIVGADNAGATFLDGRASLCFLCAAAVSDAKVSELYEATRAAFRV